ncbi:hypothetical protein [Prosthecobacter sp.]|uniref:hypothetical protein n=1 Tax=Prosthecobacter sp. TaxID=1965333 RepID=UPI0037840BA8
MFFTRATKAGRVPLRVWAAYFSVLGLLLLLFALTARLAKNQPCSKFTHPDSPAKVQTGERPFIP